MRAADSQHPVSASATPRTTTRRPAPGAPAAVLATVVAILVVALLGGLFAWRGPLGGLVGGHRQATVTTAPRVTATATPRPLALHALIVGSYSGDVSSVSPNGARNWRTIIGGDITALATDSSLNIVYAGVWFGKSHGALYALQGNTGHVLWHKAGMTPTTLQAADGIVYEGTSGIFPKSSATNFEALRASDGAIQWTFDTRNCDGSQFSLAQGAVFLDTGCSQVVALAAASGSTRWSAHIATHGTPVIVGSVAYIGYYAVGASDGKVLWNASALNPNAPLTTAAGYQRIYISSPPLLYAVNASTGNLFWNNAISGIMPSVPAVGPNALYVTTGEALEALSIADGNPLWSKPVTTADFQAPLLVGNVVYVGSSDRALVAFSATDGKLLWRAATAGRVGLSPVGLYAYQ